MSLILEVFYLFILCFHLALYNVFIWSISALHLEEFSLFKIAMPNTGSISLIHSVRSFINKTPVLISLGEHNV